MGGRKFTTVNLSDLEEEHEDQEYDESDLGEVYEQIDQEEDELSSVYEEVEEEPEKDNKIDFGKKIRDYYQDESSSDEELDEKIKEAKQLNEDLYRNLATESADLLNISSVSDITKALKDALAEEDLPSESENKIPISSEERLKLIEKYHPEFIALVNDLHTNISQAYDNILPLLNTSKFNKFCTREGIEYLDLRNELILIYMTYFAYYMLIKVNGKSVKDHPVIERLLEIRLLLDKAKPIESRLAYEISKLIELANSKDADLPQVERSRPDQLVTDDDEDVSEDSSEYEPPLTSAAPEFVTDKHSKTISKLDKIIEKRGSYANPSDSDDDSVVDEEMIKFMENEKLEQERMMRIFSGQKTKSKLKDGFSELDTLADSITSSKPWESLKEYKQKASDVQNAIKSGLNTLKQISEHSKNELYKKYSPDLPVKIIKEKPKAKKIIIPSKAEKTNKKDTLDILSTELKKVKPKEVITTVKDETVDGPRLASHEILKNKGLTRKRKKSQGNARVSNRNKYERSLKKIAKKGTSQIGEYTGEATGINAEVKKSVTVL